MVGVYSVMSCLFMINCYSQEPEEKYLSPFGQLGSWQGGQFYQRGKDLVYGLDYTFH